MSPQVYALVPVARAKINREAKLFFIQSHSSIDRIINFTSLTIRGFMPPLQGFMLGSHLNSFSISLILFVTVTGIFSFVYSQFNHFNEYKKTVLMVETV